MAKPWATYVYMAGDNSLAGAAVGDLNEMERVGSGDGLDVVVQVDRGTVGTLSGTRRLYIRADADPVQVTSPELASLGQTNSGDPSVVAAFFEDAVQRYPADRELVVLWNHGSGFLVPPEMMSPSRGFAPQERGKARRSLQRAFFTTGPAKILAAPREVRGILYDDGSSDCIDNAELEELVAGLHARLGRKIAVLGMDACLMTMLEVAVQVREHAEVLVGSEEEEPGTGWPYEVVLRAQAAGATADQLAAAIVAGYLGAYPDTQRVTQSAIRLDRLDPLVGAVDALAVALLAQSPDVAFLELLKAVRRSPRFYDGLYVDLGSLVSQLRGTSSSPAVVTACDAVRAALADPAGPILANGAKGAGLEGCCGLSIYLPMPRMPADAYGSLAFARLTRWGSMLDQVVGFG